MPNVCKDSPEYFPPLYESQRLPTNIDATDSNSESKTRANSNVNDTISVLRAFQTMNPSIKLTDDVFVKIRQLGEFGVDIYNYAQLLFLTGIVINDTELFKYINTWRGPNPLHYAALSGNPKSVKALLDLGFDKNAKSNNGATALHYAALISGNPKMIEPLLGLGFDKNARDNDGRTILHYAVFSGNPKMVEALLDSGFDRDAKDKYSATVLHCAAQIGNQKMVAALLDLGFDKKEKGNKGYNILHIAAYFGHCSLMTMLIEKYGLKPDAKNDAGRDIVHIAIARKHQETIDFCTDTTHTAQLYRNYLASFVASAIPYEVAIPDIANIIGEYAAPVDKKEQISLENMVLSGIENRNKILKPLIDFSDYKVRNDQGGRKALNEILAKKELDIYALERRLDSMLDDKSHNDTSYSYSLLRCRLNTAEKTGNAPGDTVNNLIIVNSRLEETEKGFGMLRSAHQGLRVAHEGLQANYGFQLKLLIALAVLGVAGLALGTWAASEAGQEEAEGVLIVTELVMAGLLIYGMCSRGRNRAHSEVNLEGIPHLAISPEYKS